MPCVCDAARADRRTHLFARLLPGLPAVPHVVLEPRPDCRFRSADCRRLAAWVVWRVYPAVRAGRGDRLQHVRLRSLISWRALRSFICCSSRLGTELPPFAARVAARFLARAESRPMPSRLWRREAFERSIGCIRRPRRSAATAACRPCVSGWHPPSHKRSAISARQRWQRPRVRRRRSISPFFRWATVDGMVNPFGLEVLINPDVLPIERPYVVAHEWGHIAGLGTGRRGRLRRLAHLPSWRRCSAL